MQKLHSFIIVSLLILFSSMLSRAELANVALNGHPTATAGLYGNASISKLVDGDKQNVFHGSTALPDGFAYTLDLGKNYAVTQLKIYPRQDGCCAERLTDFRVSVHGTNELGEMGAEIWARISLRTDRIRLPQTARSSPLTCPALKPAVGSKFDL